MLRDNDNPFLSKPAIAVYVLLGALLLTWILSPWTRVTTPVGLQTVIVDNPLIFGKGGVRPKALEPGSQWIWRTTTQIKVDPKPQVVTVTIDDFVSKDNILLDFESTATLQVTDWPLMLEKFGVEWWKNNLNRPYISSVRTQVKQNTMSDLMSNVEVAAKVDEKITNDLIAKIKELGMPVRVVEINLGKARPNAKILAQMDETANQQQRALTMDASKAAEDKRKAEQIAKAEADNAYRNNIGLSVDEFVQLQLADKQIQACKGAAQCVILPPGTPMVVR